MEGIKQAIRSRQQLVPFHYMTKNTREDKREVRGANVYTVHCPIYRTNSPTT